MKYFIYLFVHFDSIHLFYIKEKAWDSLILDFNFKLESIFIPFFSLLHTAKHILVFYFIGVCTGVGVRVELLK